MFKHDALVNEATLPKSIDQLFTTTTSVDAMLKYYHRELFEAAWYNGTVDEPKVMRVRALNMYGVVTEWPNVMICPTLMHAFGLLRGIVADEYKVPRGSGIPPRRIKITL
jgi:hypothetical protein